MKNKIWLLIAGIIIIALIVWYLLTKTKYKVGDVLCNPPDLLDTFTIIGFRTIDGIKNYVFQQNQDMVSFNVPVATVDGLPDKWKKVS